MIKKDYVDTGKVRFVSLDMPLEFHRYALKAAEAARCAGDQGKFWEMRDAILDSATPPAENVITELARSFQLDAVTFRGCLDSSKYRSAIKKESNQATGLRITGTPSFVIAPTAADKLYGVLMSVHRHFRTFNCG